MSIDARGKEITGICAISQEEGGNVVGTIVNEFGVKAFDFSFNGKKAKLENVFPPLNKWYIKKVLRKDIAFLLSNINERKNKQEGKRTFSINDEGEIVVANNKYHIKYTFYRLNDSK